MTEMQKQFKKIISDIEENLKNKEDIEYVKNQIYNMYNIFLDEFDKLEARSTEKMESILIRYKVLEDRMSEIENSIDKIENDIYINESQYYDFDITCPYCDTEFSVDCSDGMKDTVVCPECNHTIELEWHDHEHDGGCGSHGCHECGEDCNHSSEDVADNDDDDDM